MTNKTLGSFKNYLTLFFLFIIFYGFSQQGIVSGVLDDKNGVPLPGVSISVKGKNVGTITDFDGVYSVECSVGDILVYSYVGFENREVKVTEKMLGKRRTSKKPSKIFKRVSLRKKAPPTRKAIVNEKVSKSYTEAIKKFKKKSDALNFEDHATHKIKGSDYYVNTKDIKKIRIDSSKVLVTNYDSDVRYNIEFYQSTIYRFVTSKNLHALQTSFSQGRPISGNLLFRGPSTNEIFSFGPSLNSLGIQNERTSLFPNTYNTNTSIVFNASSNRNNLHLNYSNDTKKSIFGVGGDKRNQIGGKYSYKYKIFDLKSTFRYINQNNNQPDVNGFNSNVIRSSFSTPPSFSNNEAFKFSAGLQQSFNPSAFNNPNWLLENNKNHVKSNAFLGGIENKFRVTNEFSITPRVHFNYENNDYDFVFPVNTVGFENGYSSFKTIKQQSLTPSILVKVKDLIQDLEYDFRGDITFKNVDYSFLESDRFFQSQFLNNSRNIDLSNTTYKFLNKLKFKFNGNLEGFVGVTNNSIISQIQGNRLFQPSFTGKVNLSSLFYSSFLTNLSLSSTVSFVADPIPLLYNNTSHSSLILNPINADIYTANDELFLNKAIEFEDIESYNTSLIVGFWYNKLELGITGYYQKKQNSVVPILNNNRFQLDNVADFTTNGVDANLNFKVYNRNRFNYDLSLNFSTYKNEVIGLNDNKENVPIAGFQTISKNLIKGEPVGVIVGSTFVRDRNNKIIIGDNGFPLVSEESKIIGDPNPDFSLGIANDFKFKKFKLSFVWNFVVGGDVWNGTQQVLDFLGTSEASTNLRQVKDFVFDGVTLSGNRNEVAVDFLDSNNDILTSRLTRYGFTGIDEEAIVDGSYANLKSVNLNYTISDHNHYKGKESVFQKVEIGLYGNNLLTFSKYQGASPFTNLFNTEAGNGLQFFNTPIVSEIGFRIHLKF